MASNSGEAALRIETDNMNISPPAGIVTFLFTDIEGSTRLLRDLGEAYAHALSDHRTLCREVFTAHGGVEINTADDAFFVVFRSARAGVAAEAAAKQALFAHAWPAGTSVRVRMGLHRGEARIAGRDYIGLEVHRAAQIGAAEGPYDRRRTAAKGGGSWSSS
ncbi:MAG: hypothetical protein FJX78_05890 [Armatimonadetes bacterium]|nr:hypothetical protein [Armatimonadota bacterium]